MQIYSVIKKTRLTNNITESTTVFAVDNTTDLPVLGVGEYFVVRLIQGKKYETVFCTDVTSLNLTVTRGEENTTKYRFLSGALVQIEVYPESYEFPSGGGAVDSVNGATGVVVLDADDIDDTSTTNKFVTASDITNLGNLSGTNTGDNATNTQYSGLAASKQDVITGLTASGAELNILDGATLTTTELNYVDGVTSPIQTQLDGKAASLGADDNYVTDAEKVKLSNLSGTNTGDQTSIVGISGTKAQFDTACSDGDFAFQDDLGKQIVQRVYTQTGATASGTTQIPGDDTIPQNTEGTEFMTLSITPTDASNILEIEVTCICSVNAVVSLGVALFQDSNANALAAAFNLAAVSLGSLVTTFTHTMVAGTTSSTTFKVRAGGNAASTVRLNGQGANRIYGGVMASGIRIKEFTV